MKPLSYLNLQNKYDGKFVAIYKKKVIASAENSAKLFAKITNKLGSKDLLIQYVEPREGVCVY
jgi:hypothetical protein